MRRTRSTTMRRKKQKQRNNIIIRSLQSGVVLSSLFLGLAHQTGSTYGDFNSVQETTGELALCRVFPSDLIKLMSQLSDVLEQSATLRNQLLSPPASTGSGSSVYAPPAGSSLEEMQEAQARLYTQQQELLDRLTQLNAGAAANDAVWTELQQLADQAAGIVQELFQAARENEPNCIEIRQSEEFQTLSEQLDQQTVLSQPLSSNLRTLLSYLTAVQEAGRKVKDDPDALTLLLQDHDGPLSQTYARLEQANLDGTQALSESILDQYGQARAQFEISESAIHNQLNAVGSGISALQTAIAAEQARLEELAKQQKAEEEAAQQQNTDESEAPVSPEPSTTTPAPASDASSTESPVPDQTSAVPETSINPETGDAGSSDAIGPEPTPAPQEDPPIASEEPAVSSVPVPAEVPSAGE